MSMMFDTFYNLITGTDLFLTSTEQHFSYLYVFMTKCFYKVKSCG